MTVASMTFWSIEPADVEAALAQIAAAKKLVMASGGEDMRVGQIQTGQYTGKWIATVRYANMEAFGKSNDSLATNQEWLAIMADPKATLLARNLIRGVDIA